jgi:UDP-N-acetylmuramate dehydrogenase
VKGRSLGGAVVSPKHANFIINQGGASARHIEALMAEVAESVQARHGVALQPEVHVVGEPLRSVRGVC